MIRQWPLVGRTEELQVIAAATRAAGDRGIVLAGAAGVGKTRVAREAVASCGQRGAHRHWIVGTASARSVPLGPFADIAGDFGPDPLRRVREVIDGLIGVTRNGGVVVGVDDAHLLDDLSAFTVHQLVTRRLATVILTLRSGESAPDAITAIWKDHHLQRLELQPLSLIETTQLLEHVLDGPLDSSSAQRLWQYTQGNALYLRHLLDSEVGDGKIARHSGVWLWQGQPTLSPTLAELLDTRIAQAPSSVRDVLDALAVAEPLDTDVLGAICDPNALAQAEALDLVSIDPGARPAVRLAHPMLGEVRRTGSLRLRQLRGRIATELARRGDTDPRDLVRRAVLTMESDVAPDAGLFVAAASAAMELLDLRLAEALAARAVAADGGVEAKMAHATAITWQERPVEAETILADLANQTSGPVRTQIAILRAMSSAMIVGDAASAERQLDEAIPADDEAALATTNALRALIDLVRGRSGAAVDRATATAAGWPANGLAHMVSIWTLVSGLGDLGRTDEIASTADAGYRLAETSVEASYLRIPLAALQSIAYRLAGALTELDATAERMRTDTIDVPFQQSVGTYLAGLSAMSRGALVDAQRALRETNAHLEAEQRGRITAAMARTWLATVTAMAGRATDARLEFTAVEWWDRDPDAHKWDTEKALAEAWVCGAEGATSQAISITRDAAERERGLGRPACEVMLLQTATQFGDHTTAARLGELAVEVHGPRARAAAAHAAALAAGDGDALVDASRGYEAFGDRLAAADAAAQAVVAHHHAGSRGAALSASATAQRLAAECQGAQTPALRAATTPLSFTARQREIIFLAAQGLSNKEIADRLTISIRSIEGHIFRASQRVGATSRERLIAILQGT